MLPQQKDTHHQIILGIDQGIHHQDHTYHQDRIMPADQLQEQDQSQLRE